MNFNYTIGIPAGDQRGADEKAAALAKLATQFDARTLEALASKGKKFLRHPAYGGIIRKQLGL